MNTTMNRRLRQAARRLLNLPNESAMVFAALVDDAPGTMVDVGAHHGSTLDPFARAGWRVIAFEPDELNRRQLLENVASLPGVTVDSRAVSSVAGQSVPIYRSAVSASITTLTPFVNSHAPAGSVTTTTLAEACDEHGVTKIDFLKIDTEGYDLFVLESLDWERLQPRCVLCEFEDRKTVPLGYSWTTMAEFLASRGYRVIVAEWYPVQQYGVLHRFRHFFDYPAALVDENATGNLIAFREPGDFERFQSVRSSVVNRRFPPRRVSDVLFRALSALQRAIH
jgi:FkbM family methyltransferase